MRLNYASLSYPKQQTTRPAVWFGDRGTAQSQRGKAEGEMMTMKMQMQMQLQLQGDMQSIDVTGEDAGIG